MVATSGTVGTTQITVKTLLESALLAAGVTPENLTPLVVDIAKRNLFYYLSSMPDNGVPLWTIEQTVVGLVPYQKKYQTPVGTIDEMGTTYRTTNHASSTSGTITSSAGGTAANVLDGDMDTVCTQTAADGNLKFVWTAATAVSTVGLMSNGDQYYTLIYEVSDDLGVTWATVHEDSKNTFYPDRIWVSHNIDIPRSTTHIRVRETNGATLDVIMLQLGAIINEIVVQRSNIDSYIGLPQKDQLSRQPTQFWFNRKVSQPELWVWPVPNYVFDQLVVWRRRAIQDVGTLHNILELPDRWMAAVEAGLSWRLCLKVPGSDKGRLADLKGLADIEDNRAWSEERDKSPAYLQPNIAPYTR